MKYLAAAVFAAALAMPAAAGAEALVSNDFQNYGNGGWDGDPKRVGTSEYAGNVTLRFAPQGIATRTISTSGYAGVTVNLTFYALMLGPHGQCVAEASIDDGANWIRILRVSPGGDNGLKPNFVSKALPELDNQAKVILRLKNTSKDENANCWADNIQVTANATGGPRAAAPAQASAQTPAAPEAAGTVVWDPNEK